MSRAGPAASPTAATAHWRLDFVLLSALWGSSFLFMRQGALEFGPLPTAGLRVGIAALCLLPLLLWRQHGRTLRLHWRALLVMGVFNSALPFVCYSWAVLWLSTGLSSILNATVPLFGALVAWLWLGERLAPVRVVGLLLGFVGVALLASGKAGFRPEAPVSLSVLALLACLCATLCYGLSASFARRYLAGLPALVTATGSQLGAALALTGPMLWFWPASTPSLKAWLSMLALGALCSAVAYVLYFRLLERAGPTRTLAVTFVVPLFAIFYGVVLLGESLTLWMLGCGVVIFAGVALSTGIVKSTR